MSSSLDRLETTAFTDPIEVIIPKVKVSPIDARVGSNVHTCRDAAGYSSAHCAAILGLTVDQYVLKEAGQQRFLAQELVALAQHLLVAVASFFRHREN